MITADQLRQILERKVPNVDLFDEEYSLPDLEYPKALGARLHKLLWVTSKLFKWKRNRWDCDKFSRLAAVWASIEHALFSDKETGIAVGYATVFMEGEVAAHCIVCMVHKINGEYELRYYEPQPLPTRPEGSFSLECLKNVTSSVAYCLELSF